MDYVSIAGARRCQRVSFDARRVGYRSDSPVVVEHRDSAQLLWRLNSGATMTDAPVNRALREEVTRGMKSAQFRQVDIDTGVLLVMGTVVIAMRLALEERVVTPPARIAANMAAGMLRALGVPPRRARSLANAAMRDVIGNVVAAS